MGAEIDLKKSIRETHRWYILLALYAGRPQPVSEDILVRTLDDAKMRITHGELRKELDYLRDRKLVDLSGEQDDHWEAELTALGVDVVEYTVECKPGVARPPKR